MNRYGLCYHHLGWSSKGRATSMNRSLLDITVRPIPVQTTRWGLCYVRMLKASELDALLEIIDNWSGPERMALLVAFGACDAEGNKVFTRDDLGKLLKAPLEPLSELCTAFLDVNGMTGDPLEKKASTPSSGSTSTSPENSVTRIRK